MDADTEPPSNVAPRKPGGLSEGRKCGAKTRQSGRPCRNAAGMRTSHPGWGYCYLHLGATRPKAISAAKEAAAHAAAKLGAAIDTDPFEALSQIVGILAGQVAFLQGKVKEIDEGEALSSDALHPTIRALNAVLDQWRAAAKASGRRRGRAAAG